MLRCFGHVWLCVTLWTVAHQAPLSMGFPRQKYWSGLPCPPPKDLPSSGIKLASPMSPALAGKFFTTITNLGSPRYVRFSVHWYFNKATSKKGNPVFGFIDRNLLYCIHTHTHTHTHTHAHPLPPLPCFCTFFLQVDNASSAGSCLWTPTHQKKKSGSCQRLCPTSWEPQLSPCLSLVRYAACSPLRVFSPTASPRDSPDQSHPSRSSVLQLSMWWPLLGTEPSLWKPTRWG